MSQAVPTSDDRPVSQQSAGSGGPNAGNDGSSEAGDGDTANPPVDDGPGDVQLPMPVAGMGGSQEPQAGRDPEPPPPPPPQWTPIGCQDYVLPSLFELVKLTREVDYAAIYTTYAPGPADNPFPASTQLLIKRGTDCATATNASACETALAMAITPAADCTSEATCSPFLVSTRGDTVARDDRAAFIALLGTIDDRYKAALVAMFDGFQITCPELGGTMPLNGTDTRVTDDGFDIRTEWGGCGLTLKQTLHVAADGTLTSEPAEEIANRPCMTGRRPAGLLDSRRAPRRNALGAFFADAARLEGASVYAFERLARELGALGAPAELIADAATSALDEVRHTRSMSALALRFGAEVRIAEISELPARDALAIALENAIEGCVRETYGALLAHHQANTARDPEVRAAMLAIAQDETRHATLSWRVARWLEPRLPLQAQQALAVARAAALAQLYREVGSELTDEEAAVIGWPTAERATEIITRLGSALGLTQRE